MMVSSKKVSKTWIPLKDMNVYHSVNVAEFAAASSVDKMTAFS